MTFQNGERSDTGSIPDILMDSAARSLMADRIPAILFFFTQKKRFHPHVPDVRIDRSMKQILHSLHRNTIFRKYRQEWLYLFFGILTTIINYGMFWLLEHAWNQTHILEANLLTFVAATLFAFITNKLFVFCSRSLRPVTVFRELALFTSARIFSFSIEEAGLYIGTYILKLGACRIWKIDGIMATKMVLSVVAVMMNYFFSKFLVFAKKQTSPESSGIHKEQP